MDYVVSVDYLFTIHTNNKAQGIQIQTSGVLYDVLFAMADVLRCDEYSISIATIPRTRNANCAISNKTCSNENQHQTNFTAPGPMIANQWTSVLSPLNYIHLQLIDLNLNFNVYSLVIMGVLLEHKFRQ